LSLILSPEGSSNELYGQSYGEGKKIGTSSTDVFCHLVDDAEIKWRPRVEHTAWLMYLSKGVFTKLLWIMPQYWTLLLVEAQLLLLSDEISRFSKSSISKLSRSLSDASLILNFNSFNLHCLLLLNIFFIEALTGFSTRDITEALVKCCKQISHCFCLFVPSLTAFLQYEL
jgi:hypothetical protein